jgi:D-glycero-alpha-D-manno-heptose-7-phosphate kinase
MEKNFEAQKQLASATSNGYLEEMYAFAKESGEYGGKIAGAGGGGAYLFYCKDPIYVTKELKRNFVDCFDINFELHYEDIKSLNRI